MSSEVNFVIHCASAIRFDLPMRDLMAQTYQPTKLLLDLATHMPALRAFCYMSSGSSNPNRPRNSTVEEVIYPLGDPCDPCDGVALAESWLSMSPDQANAEVSSSGACEWTERDKVSSQGLIMVNWNSGQLSKILSVIM